MTDDFIIEKRKLLKLGWWTLFFLSLYLALLSYQSLRGNQEGKNLVPSLVTVSGKGEVTAVPSRAVFSFTVSKSERTAALAQKESASVVNDAISYLNKSGISERDLKTDNYSLYPKYEYEKQACASYPCPPGNQVIVGYEVTQTVTVRVKDLDTAPSIVIQLGKIGVGSIGNITFQVEDEEKLKTEARAKAIDDAKLKAKQLSKELGVRIVRLTSYSEDGYYPYEGGGFGAYAKSVAADDVSPELPKGENKITSRVSLTYEIR